MRYACDDCERRFRLRWKSPVGDGPYRCSVCGRRKAYALFRSADFPSEEHVAASAVAGVVKIIQVLVFAALCAAAIVFIVKVIGVRP